MLEYVDSPTDAANGAMWPLVSRVEVLARILNTPLCEARRALIDLLNAQGVDLASYQNVLGVAADRAGTSGAAPVVVDDDDDDDDN